jgi:chromosome segregation ATPase
MIARNYFLIAAMFTARTSKPIKTYTQRQTMKNKSLILAALAIAICVVGCKQSNMADENSTASDTNSPPAQQLQNAKEVATNALQQTRDATTNAWAKVKEGTTNAWADIKDSMQTTKDYTYDKKDAFVAGASADLDALDQKIKELSDKAAAASDSVKADAQPKLQDLRDKRATLDKKLDNIKNATEADWNDTKTAFQNSYDDVKNSLKQAWQWIHDKLNS